jgi:predicted ribosome-associated RNA-binding protein Tma20
MNTITAYSIYKELERILYKEKSSLSLKKAAELTHNMYEITHTLPESRQTKSRLLNMDDQQAELFQIIQKNSPLVFTIFQSPFLYMRNLSRYPDTICSGISLWFPLNTGSILEP